MMMNKINGLSAVAMVGVLAGAAVSAQAVVMDVTIDGSDAIFLAGRTDVLPIPALPGAFILGRHGGGTPEMIQETLPPEFAVVAGDVVRVLDPAVGGVSFFNGFGSPFFGPSGNTAAGSSLTALGGISGYIGPQGPLVGVFLDAAVPSAGPAPATLDFSPGGMGIDFASLSPELGQIFYIGDGMNIGGIFQEFTAPIGATRLMLGIPDGFGFGGAPGAYDDNDGAYRVRIGINEIPDDGSVPEPASAALGMLALSALGCATRRRRA